MLNQLGDDEPFCEENSVDIALTYCCYSGLMLLFIDESMLALPATCNYEGFCSFSPIQADTSYLSSDDENIRPRTLEELNIKREFLTQIGLTWMKDFPEACLDILCLVLHSKDLPAISEDIAHAEAIYECLISAARGDPLEGQFYAPHGCDISGPPSMRCIYPARADGDGRRILDVEHF